MESIRMYLNGKKTYIVAALMVLIGLINWLSGDVSLVEFINSEDVRTLLEGLGLASLRAGLSKRR